MKTVNLRINWYVYSIQILLTALFFTIFSSFGMSQLAYLIMGVSALYIFISLLLIQQKHRYVHIDRAGFSYKCLSKTCYLHSDEIAAIKVIKILGANTVSVELKSKKQVLFLFWSVDIEDVQKAAKLFDCALIGEVALQVKA